MTPTLVHSLAATLAMVRAWPAGDRVLSIYLDTTPARVQGQGHLIAFVDGCKALRERVPPDEAAAFAAAAAQAERYLRDVFVPHQHGLALFATGRAEPCQAVGLPRRPTEDMIWGELPAWAPLQALLDESEHLAVVLFDQARARLFTIVLGEIEEPVAFADDVPGKHAGGGWFALAEGRLERHREWHVAQHIQRTVAALLALQRRQRVDRLFLAGPDEAVVLLRHHLPRPLADRVAGTLALPVIASPSDVLAAVQPLVAAAARQAELAAVEQMLDAATTARAAVDFEATLAALNDRRVYRLILSDSFAGQGGACRDCDGLVAGPGPCPRCGGAVAPVAALRDVMIERALAQGARIEIVSGAAAERLLVANGLGAWTRY
jgi:hypothetical protein